jgi:hypothetical protein
MIRLFNAVLAAILGSGGSAAPAQHSRIPVVTYGANALAHAPGAAAVDDKAIKNSGKLGKVFPKAEIKKATIKSQVKAGAATKKATGKTKAKPEATKKKA